MSEQINPDVWDEADLRVALAARDISTVYRRLRGFGVTQREIAGLTGQSQSEVCEIIKGRRVMAYDVLVRIADGLGVPRGYLGLAYATDGGDSAYPGGDPSGVGVEVTDDMLRRDVLARGSVALVGVPVLGKLLTGSAGPGELGLPSRVGSADVAEVTHTADQLRVAARAHGGQARAVSAAAAQYGRLLGVPASDVVRRRLCSQLAALNNLAGWCCFDSGMDLHARWHYRTALDLAHEAGDEYELSQALRLSGVIDAARGRPDDALKIYQIGRSLLGPKGDPELVSWLHAVSAYALASMGHAKAVEELGKARGDWQSSDQFLRADMDYQTALVCMELKSPDKVEQFVASINGVGRARPVGVFARVLRATIYVQAGEPRGRQMAKSAIDAVAPLYSVRARERLQPLIAALEARPSSDHRDLAQLARKVVAADHS
ncbi:MAG: helix-turn-helix domain-containing protein [Pseudonocardiaceae bacterium]